MDKIHERVLVIESPSKWRNRCRWNGLDEEAAGNGSIVPYYTDKDYVDCNKIFSDDERREIMRAGADNETLLVRQGIDGLLRRYTPLAQTEEDIKAYFGEEKKSLQNLFRDFLMTLGGKDIRVDVMHSVRNVDSEKTEKNIKTEAGVSGFGGGKVEYSATSQSDIDAGMSLGRKITIEDTDSDFDKADEILEAHPWMREEFGMILDMAKKGKIHGEYKEGIDLTVAYQGVEAYKNTLKVAASYNLLKGSVTSENSEEVKKAKKELSHWEFSIVFPSSRVSPKGS